MFSPLAYTKTFAMAGAALLSVTLVPVLMLLFIRGQIMPEAKNPVNRFLIWIYRPDHRLGDALEEAHHRCSPLLALAISVVSGDAARQRVHADAERRHAAVHAGLAAGDVGHQGGGTAADAGQDHQELSRSGVGLRQGRARQHRDRSGAARDVRDRHQPEARSRMAPGHDHGQADRRNGQGAADSRASPTPGRCRSRRASTCSRPASARRSASRCSARTWTRWSGSPGRSRPW